MQIESSPAASPMPATRRLVWAAVGWSAGLIGSVVAVVAAVVVFGLSGDADAGEGASLDLTLGSLVLLHVPLWAALLGTPLLARRWGLRWREQLRWEMRPSDVPIGLGAGLVMQLVLLPLLYWPILQVFEDLDVGEPARELADMAVAPLDVVALVAMTVVLAPLTEEVFFRGLVQGALHDRLGPAPAVLIASVVFAVTHFQVVQFPGLLVVGVVNGCLVLATRRLGAALWSHVGFNAVTVTVLLL